MDCGQLWRKMDVFSLSHSGHSWSEDENGNSYVHLKVAFWSKIIERRVYFEHFWNHFLIFFFVNAFFSGKIAKQPTESGEIPSHPYAECNESSSSTEKQWHYVNNYYVTVRPGGKFPPCICMTTVLWNRLRAERNPPLCRRENPRKYSLRNSIVQSIPRCIRFYTFRRRFHKYIKVRITRTFPSVDWFYEETSHPGAPTPFRRTVFSGRTLNNRTSIANVHIEKNREETFGTSFLAFSTSNFIGL